jgi:hypothetical protein
MARWKQEEDKKEISSLTKSVGDGAEVSLREPTHSQERMRKKKRRLAPFEMTVWGTGAKSGRPEGHRYERQLRGDG